ncbi:MAG: hypothetical protein HC922_04510 [Leptolyngbyaceae cyanobacterium SM2_3_12]|nr:hypothetical protein [Leptolyngbyaceae cyanobacterium SM2_3_12]
MAVADKVIEPLIFDAASGRISVVSLYETTAATQKDTLKAVFKTSKSFYKTIPGFFNFAIFSSGDGTRLVELTQWQDLASYQAFKTSLTTEGAEDYKKYYEKYTQDKDGADPAVTEPFLTAAFEIDQAIAPPGMISAIPGEAALVQISGFKVDTAEHQVDLLVAATEVFETIPSLYPAPRSAILLKGVDSPFVALLSTWGTVTEFSDLSQVPTLTITPGATVDDTGENWLTQDNNLYQVVKVISAKPEKYGKD